MLLDTHVWIWAAVDERRRLGPKTRRLLARAAEAGDLYVSTMSAFEIAALHTAGRLSLNQTVDGWIRESMARGRLRVMDISTAVAIDAGAMPSLALPDPIDRLLVASARHADLPLVTRDRAILEYAKRTQLVRVTDASH